MGPFRMKRFKARRIKNEADALLSAVKMDTAMGQEKQAASGREQVLANSQQGNRNLSPSTARSWILPHHMSLEKGPRL